mgnify:FL=1|tara:strand:+ start:24 stop:1061 length:1038 start_codon:yes stop_codon:yes gene_type:complete
MNKISANLNNLFSKERNSWYLFFLIFLLFHGVNIFNLEEFSLLINDPFLKLSPERQYHHQSPIQYFIGFVLYQIIGSTYICFFIVQLLAILLLIYSVKLFSKKYLIDSDYILKVFVLSPGLLILLHWFGKPDLFLISSYLILISTSKKPLIFIASITMVFSHYQISILYFLFSFFLNLIKYKKIYFFSFLAALTIFNIYLMELGSLQGRVELYSSILDSIFLTSFNNFLLGIFSVFSWLWLPIITSKNLVSKKTIAVFFIAILAGCFGDFTRAGFLTLIPLYVYLIQNIEFKEKLLSFVNQYPIKLLALIQFQKTFLGDITEISWFWMNKEELKLLLKNLMTFIN